MAQQTTVVNEVFVGNTFGIDKKELREHFETYGVVTSVRLVYDQVTGRRRGFGFVQFKHDSSAQEALLAGTQHNLAGRCVTVQSAQAASCSHIASRTSSQSQTGHPTVSCNITHKQTKLYAEQGANTRHGQSQQGHVVSPPASPTILDVFHEVPTLPELLNMNDQKALSAASRSFRKSFVAKIRVVTVACEAQLASVNYCWPLLSMVILQTDYACFLSSPPSDRSMACVGVSAKISVPVSAPLCWPPVTTSLPGRTGKFFMLRPLHTTASSAWASTAAQQLAHHLTAKWPELDSFSLTHFKLPALGVAIIAQLAKGSYSSLVSLKLSQCGLAAQGCLHLSQGNWPALRFLDLTKNEIDVEGMALLAKANWPGLLYCQLSYNPVLDAEAIAHLAAAKWPLIRLGLSYTPVTAAMAAELAQLQLSNLIAVTLVKTGLTAAALSELARADWPVLKMLHLDHNALDAAAIQHLCRMQMPSHYTLTLDGATITGEGAFWLAQGSWPLLTDLRLPHNQLDAEAIQHIVSAVWPQLQSLSLEENPFDDDGLQQLTKGNWPLLGSLTISLNMLNRHDTVALLGLDLGQVQELKSNVLCAAFTLDNSVSRADVGLWPQLRRSKCHVCQRLHGAWSKVATQCLPKV